MTILEQYKLCFESTSESASGSELPVADSDFVSIFNLNLQLSTQLLVADSDFN